MLISLFCPSPPSLQQISLRLTYKLLWPEPRMILNSSADWSEGEINVRGDMVDNFWTPDIIIHDLVSFYKPEVLNQVAALEVKTNKRLYYKVRSVGGSTEQAFIHLASSSVPRIPMHYFYCTMTSHFC